jgi:hypothetical protein
MILTLAIAVVVTMLTVAAVTAFLVTRRTSRTDPREHSSEQVDSRIRAFELVRGNQAQVGTGRVADPPPRSVRGGGVAPGA